MTGGIGAGKSIVCQVFAVLGIPVYDADSRAKWLMDHDPALRAAIIRIFGDEAYTDGKLNRVFIGKKAFHQPALLTELNGAVHPAVGRDYKSWLSDQSTPYTIKEAALLFETGSFRELDRIIVVSAPGEIRTHRVLSRDPHRNESDVKAIMEKQWPEEKKVEKADFRIVNDDRQLVVPQVLKIHEDLINRRV